MKILTALLLLLASAAAATNANFRGLPGLLYEAEDWSAPRDAWLTNTVTANKWRLWTTEGAGKRSRDAALTTPKVARDRVTPEEGATPLQTRITGIPRGLYRAWLGPTTRPLAYSLDAGRTWLKSGGGETDLGIRTISDGKFELMVDDRFANPASIGSAYYDYIRLEPLTPPQISSASAFTRPDGTTEISWISDVPTPPATVECAGRKFQETIGDSRNHRVTLAGLTANEACAAVIHSLGATTPVKFIAGERPRLANSKKQDIELTLTEPTEFPRRQWPVTSGIPFAQGTLASSGDVELVDGAGKSLPAQFEATAFWPDGSIKWLQVSFLADTAPTPVKFHLRCGVAPQPVAPTPAAPAARLGGLAHITDASGKIFYANKADVSSLEENGPICMVKRLEGDFIAKDSTKLFRWRQRLFHYAGQDWTRVQWTIGNNSTNAILTNLRDAAVHFPLAAHGEVRGAFDGGEAVALTAPATLLQDKDDHFTATLDEQPRSGQHAAGGAFITDGTHGLAVAVPNFWQLYPKGFELRPDGLTVNILPALPADVFAKESQNAEDLIRLYYCYDRGQYRIKRGLEFSTDLYVRFAATSDARFAAWAGRPLYAVAPPAHYCASGVFGIVEPQQAGLFDAYEKMAAEGLVQLEKNRQKKHEYGWMNFGDWHGERHFNWGNHEYDMMGALALQFIRTGNPQWLRWAEECTRHSTTIDTVHYPWQARMAGRVYAHSVGHVGGFFDMTDPRFRALGNVFGLSDPSRPNAFITGAIDPGGHIFQPGNFRVGFLTGERRYREVAEMVCGAQAAYMTRNFDFGIERAAGWPLMNAVSAYEATGNPFFLNAAKLYVEKITGKQTERGDWGLRHGPPECLHQPSHPGGKAFAAGVLLNGLMMFDAVAPSAAVKQCIARNAHWLEKYAWNHETHSFRYIDTCPTFEKGRGNGGTDLLVASGLAYACTLDRDPALRALLLDSLGRALPTRGKAGKDFIQDIRQTPHALAILHQRLGVSELPVVEQKKK
jgi:hypothetical protein